MKRPWMPLYVSDFINSEEVIDMPPDACGVYIKLLCFNWEAGDLPSDPDRLAKMVRINPRSFRRLWPIIQHLFPEYSPGRLGNDRVMNELKEADKKSENSRNAVKIRESRRSNVDASQHSTAHNSTAQHKENTNAAAPLELVPVEPNQVFDFASVYDAYPRKEGKTKGIARLRSQVRTPEAFESLKRAVGNFADKHRSENTETQFVPHFSTWCSGAWRDYIDGPHIVEQAVMRGKSLPPSTSVTDSTRAKRKF